MNKIEAKKPNLVLLGMPGSGKTTVGREVANRTGMDFVDADEYLVAKQGRTVDEIVGVHGWDHFRALESQTLAELAERNNTVIATGGGAVLNPENSANLLVNGVSVLLETPIKTLVKRSDAKKNPNRPPMNPDQSTLEDFTGRWEARKELYAGAADYKIANKTDDPSVVVEQIVCMVQEGGLLRPNTPEKL